MFSHPFPSHKLLPGSSFPPLNVYYTQFQKAYTPSLENYICLKTPISLKHSAICYASRGVQFTQRCVIPVQWNAIHSSCKTSFLYNLHLKHEVISSFFLIKHLTCTACSVPVHQVKLLSQMLLSASFSICLFCFLMHLIESSSSCFNRAFQRAPCCKSAVQQLLSKTTIYIIYQLFLSLFLASCTAVIYPKSPLTLGAPTHVDFSMSQNTAHQPSDKWLLPFMRSLINASWALRTWPYPWIHFPHISDLTR